MREQLAHAMVRALGVSTTYDAHELIELLTDESAHRMLNKEEKAVIVNVLQQANFRHDEERKQTRAAILTALGSKE